MNIGAILAGVGLLVVVVAYVARPLFERQPKSQEIGSQFAGRAQLTTRRDAIYALIRELDADYATGKVNDQDYQVLREQYVAEGVSILKQLDALSNGMDRAAVEAEIEARVLAMRQPEVTIAAESGDQSAPRFCTQCGHPADPDNRFCAQCGASLKEAAS